MKLVCLCTNHIAGIPSYFNRFDAKEIAQGRAPRWDDWWVELQRLDHPLVASQKPGGGPVPALLPAGSPLQGRVGETSQGR